MEKDLMELVNGCGIAQFKESEKVPEARRRRKVG